MKDMDRIHRHTHRHRLRLFGPKDTHSHEHTHAPRSMHPHDHRQDTHIERAIAPHVVGLPPIPPTPYRSVYGHVHSEPVRKYEEGG